MNRRKRLSLVIALALILGCFQNCSGSLSGDNQTALNSSLQSPQSSLVAIAPQSASLAVGQNISFSVTGGAPPYNFSFDTADVASFDSNSKTLTALMVGATNLIVSDANGAVSKAAISVSPSPSSSSTTTTTTTTTTAATLVPVYRYFSSTNHIFSLDANAADGTYTAEGVAFNVFPNQVSGTAPLMSCMYNGGSQFLSMDTSCGGQVTLGQMGYIYSAQPAANGTALYMNIRYTGNYIYNDFLATTNASEGQSLGYSNTGVMGYVPTN